MAQDGHRAPVTTCSKRSRMKSYLVIFILLAINLQVCFSEVAVQEVPKDKEIVEERTAKVAVNPRDPKHRNAANDEQPKKAEAQKSLKDKGYKLATDDSCKTDVHELCQHVKLENNFAVLTCLQDAAVQASNPLSQDCHQRLWSYKEQLTKDERFDEAAKNLCKKTLEKDKLCATEQDLKPGGNLINCLIEHQETINEPRCHQFVIKMAAVVFSDYRLIKGFYDQCKLDVEKLGCGRISREGEDDLHGQGDVIECLKENIQKVNQNCQKEILRVAELSSDDYHMDRALFYACQGTRERLCRNVQSGGGQVYKCLLAHIEDNAMVPQCKEMLKVREQLSVEDVKVNHALWTSCKADFKKHNCQKGDTEHGKAAHLLVCLSEAAAEGHSIEPLCLSEMQDFSMRLFAEYKLSPELVAACEHEVNDLCKEHMHEENGALNCLMRLGSAGKLGESCYLQVNEVLKETNAGNDYKIDRPLYLACESVVQTTCKGKPTAMILGCLMDNMHSDSMIPTCQEQLYHLQYFMARDFRLDRDLFQSCNKDAKHLCNAPVFQEKNPTMPHGIVLSCLYRSSLPSVEMKDRTSASCGAHIQRVMRQRAASVSLIPTIEENCKKDLAEHCLDKQGPGEEIACLQEEFDGLEQHCRDAIANFTELEAEDTSLDRALIDTCAPMVVKFCQNAISAQNSDAVLPCLIEHKNEPDMDVKCKASVDHWQMLELKSFKFSHGLKKKCAKDISSHCNGVKTKLDAIHCLSALIHTEAMGGAKTVSLACQQEIREEFILQTENIKFNPELYEKCKDDIAKHCSNVEFGGGQVEECLRLHANSLSTKCRNALRIEEEAESKDTELDYVLMKNCKHEIQLFCHDEIPETFMSCLRKHMREPQFGRKCKKVVKERQIEAAKDTILDSELQGSCSEDIKHFCSIADQSAIHEDLSCLKKHMKDLSTDCQQVVKSRQIEQSKDIRLNIPVATTCQQQIFELCDKLEKGRGEIVECLKKNYRKIKGKDCQNKVKEMVEEMQRDLHLDPPLHKACRRDIKKFCDDEEDGEGEVLQCLMDVFNAKKKRLKPECRNFLKNRMSMWSAVGSSLKLESLSDFASAIDKSPNRSYLYTITLCFLVVIFVGGLCFGRVTKRIRRDIKDR